MHASAVHKCSRECNRDPKKGLELDRGITGTGDASKAEPAAR